MSSLFGILNIGTKGLFAQQTAIDVTSHNISNASTSGYSRQVVTMQEAQPMSVYGTAGQLGTGVDVTAINRVRDAFLDSQVRAQTSISGQYTSLSSTLSQVENVINEPSTTGISSSLSSFFNAWSTLATSPNDSNAQTMVAQQSVALTTQLNETSTELQNLKTNSQNEIQSTVYNINSILSKINSLNQQIQKVTTTENTPNDLMDQRDLLLDQLSNNFGINVTNTPNNGINVTTSSQTPQDKPPLGTDGNPLNLVQATNPGQTTNSGPSATLAYIKSVKAQGTLQQGQAGMYTVTYFKNGDVTSTPVTMTVDIEDTSTGTAASKVAKLSECGVLWADSTGAAIQVDTSGKETQPIPTDGSGSVTFDQLALFQPSSGTLNGYTTAQSYIDTYQNNLDNVAKSLAFAVNGIISQSPTFKADGSQPDGSEGGINNFFVNSNPVTPGTFTDTDEKNITAANITVNPVLLSNSSEIKTATLYDSSGNNLSGESDGNRARAIADLSNNLMNITQFNTNPNMDRQAFLGSNFAQNSNLNNVQTIVNNSNGTTLNGYFTDTVDTIGVKAQYANQMVTTQTGLISSLNQSRASVSGVSLDEEMANLVQYQHCYQGNAKVISTVDSLLDVIINGLMSNSG